MSQNSALKVGDKVYCSEVSLSVLTLIPSPNSQNLLAFEHGGKLIEIPQHGRLWKRGNSPIDHVFLATAKNHEKIVALYDIDLQAPTGV